MCVEEYSLFKEYLVYTSMLGWSPEPEPWKGVLNMKWQRTSKYKLARYLPWEAKAEQFNFQPYLHGSFEIMSRYFRLFGRDNWVIGAVTYNILHWSAEVRYTIHDSRLILPRYHT